MDTTSTKTINFGSGIKMPTLKYKFVAHFMSPNNISLPELSTELEYINYDMKTKTGESFIRIPYDGGTILNQINEFCNNGGNIMIEIKDGRSVSSNFNIYLEDVEVLECPLQHVYADSDILGPKIIFKYTTLRVFTHKS
jgi:hypothetical protein